MPVPTPRPNAISREEFVELRGQVANIANSVQSLTNTFAANLKQREASQKAELVRIEAETHARFEKNEEASAGREKTNIEGRRWLIIVLVGLVGAVITVISFFGSSIKDSTLSLTRFEKQPLEQNVATLTTLTSNLVQSVTALQSWSNKIDSQNAVSITDRLELNRRQLATFDAQAETARELAALKSEISSKFQELDSKFMAEEQINSAATTDLWRVSSVLWNTLSSMGAKLPTQPTAPYFTPSLSGKGSK